MVKVIVKNPVNLLVVGDRLILVINCINIEMLTIVLFSPGDARNQNDLTFLATGIALKRILKKDTSRPACGRKTFPKSPT